MASTAHSAAQYADDILTDEMIYDGLSSDDGSDSAESVSRCRDKSPADHWLGKKLFDYLIAKHVVASNGGVQAMEHLDVSRSPFISLTAR